MPPRESRPARKASRRSRPGAGLGAELAENAEQGESGSGIAAEEDVSSRSLLLSTVEASPAGPSHIPQQGADAEMGDGEETSQAAEELTMSSAGPNRGSRSSTTKAFANSKFKPKAVGRRAQIERDAMEKEADKKQQDRQAVLNKVRVEEERITRLSQQGHPGRSRGRDRGRGRGRGAPSRGMFGQPKDRQAQGMASGPFSGPSADIEPVPRGGGPKGRGGRSEISGPRSGDVGNRGGGGSHARSARGGDEEGELSSIKPSLAGTRKTKIKTEVDPENKALVETSLSMTGRMKNIDDIYIISDDDEDAVELIHERRLKPIRLEREEHVDRQVKVNTEASSTKAAQTRQQELDPDASQVKKEKGVDDSHTSGTRAKSSRKEKDVEFIRDERRWKGVYSDEDAAVVIEIKREPSDNDVEMSDVQAEVDPPAQGADPSTQPTLSTTRVEDASDEPQSPSLSKRHRLARHLRPPTIQTAQDQEEWDRIVNSRVALVEELSMSELPVTQGRGGIDEQPFDKRENKVYLFQLPPLLPNLMPAEGSRDSDKGKGKEIAASSQSQQLRGDLSRSSILGDEHSANFTKEGVIQAPDEPDFTGQIGTLSVYEDGETSFSWGGIEHEVRVGCGGDLLQEVVVAEVPGQASGIPNIPRAEQSKVGEAMAMGQLDGKFIVTPKWNSLFDRS